MGSSVFMSTPSRLGQATRQQDNIVEKADGTQLGCSGGGAIGY
jgi:hypothetical protein